MKKWIVTAGLLTCASLVAMERVEAKQPSPTLYERSCKKAEADCYRLAQVPNRNGKDNREQPGGTVTGTNTGTNTGTDTDDQSGQGDQADHSDNEPDNNAQ